MLLSLSTNAPPSKSHDLALSTSVEGSHLGSRNSSWKKGCHFDNSNFPLFKTALL